MCTYPGQLGQGFSGNLAGNLGVCPLLCCLHPSYGTGVTESTPKPSVVVIPVEKHVAGMTGQQAVDAGGIVLCGVMSADHRADIAAALLNSGHHVELVSVTEPLQIIREEMLPMRHINFQAIAGLMNSGIVTQTAAVPAAPRTPVDCTTCKHYVRRDPRDGGHCHMFEEKPGPWCAQFKKDTSPVTKQRDADHQAAVEAIRAENARRKAENFAKRQPK